jgi:putative transcriptional regulator
MENGLRLRNRVKELRARLNLRQSDLAREVDVTRQTILAIEKGRLNPSVMVSLKIARVLREPVGYVFYLDHSPEGPHVSEQDTRVETYAA